MSPESRWDTAKKGIVVWGDLGDRTPALPLLKDWCDLEHGTTLWLLIPLSGYVR